MATKMTAEQVAVTDSTLTYHIKIMLKPEEYDNNNELIRRIDSIHFRMLSLVASTLFCNNDQTREDRSEIKQI